ERHVEEALLGRLVGFVESVRDRVLRNSERLFVRGEGALAAAEQVARELVEEDEERIGALRRVLPIGQFPGGGGFMGRQEALPDLGVQGVVLGEPFLRAGSAPEGDDVGGARQTHRWLRSSKAGPEQIKARRGRVSTE